MLRNFFEYRHSREGGNPSLSGFHIARISRKIVIYFGKSGFWNDKKPGKLYYFILLMLCIAYSPIAESAQPDCIRDIIKAEAPYGTATLNKFVFHVYDAEFWTEDNGWQQDAPYALHLTYGVDIEKQDFLERTLEELDRQKAVTPAIRQQFSEQLTAIYPDVVDGDTITALHIPSEGIRFCHNGKPVGQIKDEALVQPFFAIWLGEETSEPSIRDKLLKRNSGQ